MTQEIESVRPILTVIDDDGDLILSSTGPRGKSMAQSVLALAAGSRKITVISDGEMKVMKRNEQIKRPSVSLDPAQVAFMADVTASLATPTAPAGPDIQDQFISDLAAGRTGEAATGESPSPTPGPSDPVPVPSGKPAADQPAARRVPRIYQDAAAPPAPELAEQEMANLLAEAAAAEQEAARAAEDRRFQSQQAVQAGVDQTDPTSTAADPAAAAKPRARRERNLATSGRPCGNCNGGGQSIRIDSTGSPILDGQGQMMSGVCQVCSGTGQVKSWDRAIRR